MLFLEVLPGFLFANYPRNRSGNKSDIYSEIFPHNNFMKLLRRLMFLFPQIFLQGLSITFSRNCLGTIPRVSQNAFVCVFLRISSNVCTGIPLKMFQIFLHISLVRYSSREINRSMTWDFFNNSFKNIFEDSFRVSLWYIWKFLQGYHQKFRGFPRNFLEQFLKGYY